jgi:hypothetical protein
MLKNSANLDDLRIPPANGRSLADLSQLAA